MGFCGLHRFWFGACGGFAWFVYLIVADFDVFVLKVVVGSGCP